MQTVLSQLNSVPGVVGSLVCDPDGQLTAHVFPPLFDVAALQDAARALADGAVGLEVTSDTAELLDVRFKEARLLAKPFGGSMLAVLCTKTTNVQFLTLSLGAAVAKLDKLRQATPAAPAPAPAAAPAPVASAPAPEAAAPGAKRRVAAPTKGLDELRRRLAEGGAAARPGGAAAPATSAAEPQAKQDETTTSASGLRWWEGMP
ncbi:roadblock/LC7 domain-containing protein [Anaeromyxobacter diazotrophicus]|uniref:Roadblock/LAMTOR2 domain-containing protein n=1 Tax=Anaeromyxobacter diazotrophicus TaxID=2590199 RepID=A0A7I9VJH3_9BACT|nr:roadblock/LC7 domain-containing protein [Anaeromyxobacter diazotrophicus]GEJ56515.1 hypothetical protein AMYX_12560 [Anaeromyxobacter diazotrophicus]